MCRCNATWEKEYGSRYFEIIEDCLFFGIVPIVSFTLDIETILTLYVNNKYTIAANHRFRNWRYIIVKNNKKTYSDNIRFHNLKQGMYNYSYYYLFLYTSSICGS